MSFSSDAKAELCQPRPDRKSLALAECYGALLYGHSFSAREIRLITGSADFAQRLPELSLEISVSTRLSRDRDKRGS